MLILLLKIKLHTSWVHSLKEKHMVAKSLLSKVRNRLDVAAAKAGEWDIHQTIVTDVATIVSCSAQANSATGEVRYFIKESTEAEITSMEREIF